MKGFAKCWQVVALLGVTGILACNQERNEVVVRNAVLKPGETVEAHNSTGKIKIAYVDATKRRYHWDGKSRVVAMVPREEVFDGKLGLYEPADSWGLSFWKDRLVVQESVISFESIAAIEAFLLQSRDYMNWVYNDDGLVVGFGRTPARKQINIDLWQLLLQGEKPKKLKGAQNTAIQLTVQ